MMTDEKPRTDDATVVTPEQAKELHTEALKQLTDARRISRGTKEIKRVNGIANALSLRWATHEH